PAGPGGHPSLDLPSAAPLHRALAAAVPLGVPLLAATAAPLGDGPPVHADGVERLPDSAERHRTDDCGHELHVHSFVAAPGRVSDARADRPLPAAVAAYP